MLQAGEVSLAATAWWTIANSADRRDFEYYLELFPDSDQASAAQRQLALVDEPDFPLMELAPPSTNPVIPGGLDSLITQCDLLASAGRGYMSLVEAIPHHLINIRAATRACIEAVENDPENPRLVGLLAGVMYQDERYAEAIYYGQQALELGNAAIYALFSRLYRFGLGVEPSIERSADFALQGILAGVSQLRTVMGVNYREGRGVPQSFHEASRWFELAAYDGQVAGMTALGDMYRRGQLGVIDHETALEYYFMAAALNHSDAIHNIGMAYMRGEGVERDFETGLSYLARASDIGNPYSAYQLGRSFHLGRGVDPDRAQARAYYRLSAQRNFLRAYFALGEFLSEGDREDWPQALANFIIAREAGILRDTENTRALSAMAQERIYALSAEMTQTERVSGEQIAQNWIDQYGLLDFTLVNN